VADWINIVVTLVLGAVGLYLAHSFRRQIQARVAEKRFESYGRLWAELKVASPLRRLTGEGPLSQDERRKLYDKLTDWYYDCGNGMLLSQQTATMRVERVGGAEVPEELGFQVDTTVKAITDLPELLRG
jgi:hypothetical protein